jgi:hypothetical protein
MYRVQYLRMQRNPQVWNYEDLGGYDKGVWAYDRITAEKDRERKEKQARSDRVRREKEQSARSAMDASKQRADVSRAMASGN